MMVKGVRGMREEKNDDRSPLNECKVVHRTEDVLELMYVCLILWSSVLGFRTHFAIISQTELLNITALLLKRECFLGLIKAQLTLCYGKLYHISLKLTGTCIYN